MDRKAQLIELLKESPRDSFLLFALAKEFESSESWETAIDYYHQILENEPKYIGAYYHLAQAYIQSKDKTNALQVFENGIAMAVALHDHHAKAELQNAKMNLLLEE